MQNLWNPEVERSFFEQSLQGFSSPEQLFYLSDNNKYLAYWPKKYKGKKSTLQSRNALIGNFTETWVKELIQNCLIDTEYHTLQGAICKEVGLSSRSPADVVITRKKNTSLTPQDIVVIFEVKMSVVWNWEYKNRELICLGDYQTHQGNPGLLRSDSMLKAIGKSINIRVSSYQASTIPIIVIGNTPITENYYNKVDHLKTSGIIQGFWSVNPQPRDDTETINATNKKGFIRFDTYASLQNNIDKLLSMSMNFFSGMKSKEELGRLIQTADKARTYEEKANIFLNLLKDEGSKRN